MAGISISQVKAIGFASVICGLSIGKAGAVAGSMDDNAAPYAYPALLKRKNNLDNC